jgi:hypothetical protein
MMKKKWTAKGLIPMDGRQADILQSNIEGRDGKDVLAKTIVVRCEQASIAA